MLNQEGVKPKTEEDEDDDAAAEEESAFAFEAGFAEQAFEGAVGHSKFPLAFG